MLALSSQDFITHPFYVLAQILITRSWYSALLKLAWGRPLNPPASCMYSCSTKDTGSSPGGVDNARWEQISGGDQLNKAVS